MGGSHWHLHIRHAETWCKENGKNLEFDTKEAAEDFVKEISGYTTTNVYYYVREKEPELNAIRRVAQPENQKGINKLKQKAGKKQKHNRECR